MENNKKIDRWVNFFCGVALLLIGFFCGSIFEQGERISYDNNNSKLSRQTVVQKRSIDWWKEGYLNRDSALTKISNHKHCTNEIRGIIADIY